MDLPDAEALCEELARKLRAGVTESTGLVGIRTGGAWLAERMHRELKVSTPMGTLDISFYRDDFDVAGLHHPVKPSQIPFDVNGRHIVVIDDVLYTGRTVRAAMNELFDYGRPASISLVVLADRGGRQLPICAQHCGARVEVPSGMRLRLKRDAGDRLALALEPERAA